jgi:hypothetical protein
MSGYIRTATAVTRPASRVHQQEDSEFLGRGGCKSADVRQTSPCGDCTVAPSTKIVPCTLFRIRRA